MDLPLAEFDCIQLPAPHVLNIISLAELSCYEILVEGINRVLHNWRMNIGDFEKAL